MIKRVLAILGLSAPQAATAGPIERIDTWLAEHRPAYYEGLNPGVNDAALDALAAQFDLVLPDAFRQLYLWRNGHSDYVAPSLVLNLQFPSLEALASTKTFLDDLIGYDFPDQGFWERSWVPFLENGGGDHLAFVADGSASGGAVVMFYHDDPYRGERAGSLADWLEALASSMEDGSYEVDGETFSTEQ
ncbi:SMI1/KNR4 family protein [Gymnodinialimonas hymeniacidonis]|uniref:SMI1/KNR4 family protein n=1 Tax=Gymnodinialimonas hymeniacidonis TaxID=3126508 RepID=UPI0034C628A5